MKLTLSEIAAICGGTLLSGGPETEVARFFTDSRKAGPGGMFVPIRGENWDGHSFIPDAFAAGAAASFTARPVEAPGPLVLVADCREALQRTAAAYRERFSIPVVGITGSVGKTTAKEMVAQGLSKGFLVYRTPGNHNSQVGVPITVCGLEPWHTAAVIEMGVSMPGEMERIARVAKPTCGVFTTIGTSHIQYMQTRENILAEKARLADYLPEGAPLFVNGDNDLLPGLRGSFPVVTFGLGEGCQWRGLDIREADGGLAFVCRAPDGQEQPVRLPVVGAHNVRNALAALAVASHLGQSLADTAQALGEYVPPAMRQVITVREDGVAVIDDSYNASPDSMRSAIQVLMGREGSGRRVAVLAGMLELGGYTRQGHLDTGRYAKEMGVDQLIAVGELAEGIAEGFGPGARLAADNQEAVRMLEGALHAGDAVLVKGSRGMKTEEVVKALLASASGSF